MDGLPAVAPGAVDLGPQAADPQRLAGSCGICTAYIEPRSTWQKGFAESFNLWFSDEFLNTELFATGAELQAIADRCRWEYNTFRPDSAL